MELVLKNSGCSAFHNLPPRVTICFHLGSFKPLQRIVHMFRVVKSCSSFTELQSRWDYTIRLVWQGPPVPGSCPGGRSWVKTSQSLEPTLLFPVGSTAIVKKSLICIQEWQPLTHSTFLRIIRIEEHEDVLSIKTACIQQELSLISDKVIPRCWRSSGWWGRWGGLIWNSTKFWLVLNQCPGIT